MNTHVHLPPNFSAFESVEQAVDLAASQGVRVLGASNYYDFSSYPAFGRIAAARGVYPLYSTEIIAMQPDLRDRGVRVNDPGNPGKTYLCGKAITRFDPPSPEAARRLAVIRARDEARIAELVRALERWFASQGIETALTCAKIIGDIVKRHGSPRDTVVLQERHVAMAYQERLFEVIPESERGTALGGIASGDAARVQNELRSRLMKFGKPCFVAETYLDMDEARALVRDLGGIECYPVAADMVTPMCEFESDAAKLADALRASGFRMAEFIPTRNEPRVLEEYARTIRAAGIAVAIGTEHNTTDLIPLAPACRGGRPLPESLLPVFREGACVMAAHQERVAAGRPGFAPAEGASVADDDARIREFAKEGEAAILARLAEWGEGRAS